MKDRSVCLLISTVLASSLIVSCSQFSPPQSCGAGGTANGEIFNQNFAVMVLYDEVRGGSPLIDTEAGPTFFPERPVSVQTESFSSVEIRFCVEERKGGGMIRFDEVRMIPVGLNTHSLGNFETGSYVIRVILDDILVRNLPFVVQ